MDEWRRSVFSYRAVLDLVALPQPPEANPTGYQVAPANSALVPRLPRPPETSPTAVDQSAEMCPQLPTGAHTGDADLDVILPLPRVCV